MKYRQRYAKMNKENSRLERGRKMRLKTRLITAFFVIACVPLMLAVIAFAGFSYVQVNALKTKLGITDISYENLANTLAGTQ